MNYFKLRYNHIILLAISFALVISFALPVYAQTSPGKPDFLSATAASSSQVNLSWTAPTSGGAVTGYKIEVKPISASDYPVQPLVANTGNTGTTYTHNGVQVGEYLYRVSAINQNGAGPPSPEAYVKILTSQNIVPGIPTNVSATPVSPTQINLSWNAPAYNGGPTVTGYRIDLKIGSGSYSTFSSNTGPVTSFSHLGLTTGTTYYYKIYAINSVGPGNASSEVSATPTSSSSSTVPNPPTNLVATQTTSTQIDLSWTAPSSSSPITGYKIEEKIGAGSYSVIVSNTESKIVISQSLCDNLVKLKFILFCTNAVPNIVPNLP